MYTDALPSTFDTETVEILNKTAKHINDGKKFLKEGIGDADLTQAILEIDKGFIRAVEKILHHQGINVYDEQIKGLLE